MIAATAVSTGGTLAQVPQLTLRSGISTFFLNLRLASARNGLNLSHLEIAL
jgi:hypothetical protein